MGGKTGREIKAVGTTFEILAVLKELGEARISEITGEVDLSKGTVHTHLSTLRKRGYVDKEDERYRLGLKWITLGEHVRNREELYKIAREDIDELARSTGEYAHLITHHHTKEIALYEAHGDRAVAPDYHTRLREEPQYLHITASGKSMLAHFPERRVERIIDEEGLRSQTENTITDREGLYEDLERVRERGFAINDEEETYGICSVGAPLLTTDGDVLGAVSLSVPTNRMSEERFFQEYPHMVMETSNVIEVKMETAHQSL